MGSAPFGMLQGYGEPNKTVGVKLLVRTPESNLSIRLRRNLLDIVKNSVSLAWESLFHHQVLQRPLRRKEFVNGCLPVKIARLENC